MDLDYPTHIINNSDKLAKTTFVPTLLNLDKNLLVTPFVFAFQNSMVMLSLDKNGWWNPQGGHQEGNETLTDAVTREAYEEAGILISGICFVGAIKFETIEYKSEKSRRYPAMTYLPIGYAKIDSIDHDWVKHETKDRKLSSYPEALELLRLRTDNGLMLKIFQFIFEVYNNKDGKN